MPYNLVFYNKVEDIVHSLLNIAKARVLRYDIIASTNNQQFIDGAYKNQRVVTYNVKKPKKKLFTEDDLFETDCFSFGTQIGQITNTCSTICSLLPNFDEQSEEYKLLCDRLKAGCAAQSRQIDKTKIGENVKTLGSICKQYQRIDNTKDTPEQIERKMFYNRILADKKPYFFKYKYNALNKELNDYTKKHDENAQIHFSKTLQQLLEQEHNNPQTLDESEVIFLNYYHRFLPVVDSDCVMNKICRYIESIDFEIKKRVRTSSDFDYKVLMSSNTKIDARYSKEVLLPIIQHHMNEWSEQSKAKKLTKAEKNLSGNTNMTSFEKEALYNQLKDDLLKECPNEEKLADYLIYIFYKEKASFNKSTLWILVGKQIYENIKNKHESFMFPVKNFNGNINFLYESYMVEPIQIENNENEEDKTSNDNEIDDINESFIFGIDNEEEEIE